MRVVPVSIAALALSPVGIVTVFPCTVTWLTCNNQYFWVPEVARFKYSMSPVYNEELVPPRVKTPPNFSLDSLVDPNNLFIQKDISGVVNWPPLARACQKGVAWVLANASKARPIIPALVPDRRFWLV